MIKKGFLIVMLTLSSNYSICATAPISLDVLLTDVFSNGTPGAPKSTFTQETPIIYALWQSNQIKPGQKIKYVCVAENTYDAAPPNTVVDSLTVEVPKTDVPVNQYFNGKFTQYKPKKGWPTGSYHMDFYVNGTLSKTLKFTIIKGDHSQQPETTHTNSSSSTQSTEKGWEAISIDSANHTKNTAFGIGSADTKADAEKYAQKFCIHTGGGTNCSIVLTYQQCGAYAISDHSQGSGTGSTKKAAEAYALSECNDSDCAIVASDCNT